jgi:hypothetical protein
MGPSRTLPSAADAVVHANEVRVRPVLRVVLSIPDAYVERAAYVFSVFGDQWGLPVSISRDPFAEDADVWYGAPAERDTRDALVLPFDHRLYDPACSCTVLDHDGVRLWSRPGVDVFSSDLVASSYRLLTLLDEGQVDPAARDRRGVFTAEALPPERRRTAALPVVDDQAAFLLARLESVRPGVTASGRPKWPGGKSYAVAITHDTDAITIGSPRELATNLTKFALRRDRRFAGMVRDGLRYMRNPTGNPLFGFPRWREVEDAQPLRSCFFLYAKVGPIKHDVNNCKSSVVEQRIDWSELRRMHEDGWEFGFHAPINARLSLDPLARGKQWIEDRLGAPVNGVRHHYWALDWYEPHLTFRKHVNSGFRYDSSLAWRDISGFRAGTCHPFRPFDPGRCKPLDIYELPTCLMDGHALAGDADPRQAAEVGLETVDHVRRLGGVAVLDWHTESACNRYVYRHHRTAFEAIVERVREDGDAWWATPWEIVQHWHRWRAGLATGW